jgi:hypothetical protein
MSDVPPLFGRFARRRRPAPPYWDEVAGQLGLDPLVFASLLQQLDAPESLQGLLPVLSGLPLVLTAAHDLAVLDADGYVWWVAQTRELSRSLIECLRTEVFRRQFPRLNRSSPHALCESHPYYAVLVVLPRLSTSAPDLPALVVRCWRAALEQDEGMLPSQHTRIGLALRAIYDARGCRPMLHITADMDDDQVAAALARAAAGVGRTARDYVDALRRVLLRAYESSLGDAHGGGPGGGSMRGQARTTEIADFSEHGLDPDGPPEEVRPRLDFTAAARTRQAIVSVERIANLGLAPGDAGSTAAYASVPSDPLLSIAETLDRRRRRVDMRSVAADIAMRVQPLGYRWELPTPAELAIMLREIDRLLAPKQPDEAAKLHRNLAVLLVTMLHRGMAPEAVLRCRLAVIGPEVAEPADERDILLLRLAPPRRKRDKPGAVERAYWRLRPRLVVGGAPIDSAAAEPTQEYLRLTLPPPLAAFYIAACRDEIDQWGQRETIPLVRQPERVLALLPDWCSSSNSRHGTRLTPQRISGFLARRAAADAGVDAVSVALIRGRTDVTSATQAYYQLSSPERLDADFAGFWRHVLEEARAEVEDSAPAWLSAPWPRQQGLVLGGQSGVGSRKVPSRSTVRNTVAHLRRRVWSSAKTYRSRGTPERLAEAHNAYALYTMHCILWSLAARGIRDPVPDLRHLDRRSGLVALCDKSAEDRYSTRLVWAPDGFFEHLEHYRKHLDALAERLLLYAPTQADRIQRSLVHWRDSASVETVPEGLPAVVVEIIDGKLVPLTAEDATGARMPLRLRLAANSSRHYLRTYLADVGCPDDLIDAQLGHWQHGREPWGASSSLAPVMFARAMSRYLGGVLADLGFRPVRSPLLPPGR